MTDAADKPPANAQILKFQLPIDDQWHDIPIAYTHDPMWPRAMWHIGMQNDTVMLWMRPARPDDPFSLTDKLKVVGTGHDYDDRNIYVGTVQDPRGFVWHIITGGY